MRTIKSLLVPFLSFLVIVSLAGCGSGGSASSADNPVVGGTGGGTTPTGIARLSWAAPINADGTPLTGITGFKVYYGTSPGTYSSSINVGLTTSYAVNGLAPGTYYFTVTACDSSGNESSFSNEASKTIL